MMKPVPLVNTDGLHNYIGYIAVIQYLYVCDPSMNSHKTDVGEDQMGTDVWDKCWNDY